MNTTNKLSLKNDKLDSTNSDNYDVLLPSVLLDFVQAGEGSLAKMQSKYNIGYVRAGVMIDQMLEKGYILKDPTKSKYSVLITMEKYKKIFGDKK